jgi:hypothetical protein
MIYIKEHEENFWLWKQIMRQPLRITIFTCKIGFHHQRLPIPDIFMKNLHIVFSISNQILSKGYSEPFDKKGNTLKTVR